MLCTHTCVQEREGLVQEQLDLIHEWETRVSVCTTHMHAHMHVHKQEKTSEMDAQRAVGVEKALEIGRLTGEVEQLRSEVRRQMECT